MKNRLRNFIWIISGIILMAIIVIATTNINDLGITTVNISAENITATRFFGDGSSITGVSTFNDTYNIYAYNMTDGNDYTYNVTYNTWAYNQTYTLGTYNVTYNEFAYNMSTWNYNATYNTWAYNQTTATGDGSYNVTYHTFVVGNKTNSSVYWGNLSTFNATQMENNDGILSIITSWIEGLFFLKSQIVSLIYNRTEIDTMNSTWSSTYNITYNTWAYNMTGAGDGSYNVTYATWSYNQTYTLGTYNVTYNTWAYNQTSPAQVYADTNFHNKSADINPENYNISLGDDKYICLGDSGCADSYIVFNGTALVIKVN